MILISAAAKSGSCIVDAPGEAGDRLLDAAACWNHTDRPDAMLSIIAPEDHVVTDKDNIDGKTGIRGTEEMCCWLPRSPVTKAQITDPKTGWMSEEQFKISLRGIPDGLGKC
ncbi:unnamed protein product [Protopolystoma xenopodis]|uniref:Uncharacterized protein n=1 Tax=Protopolystoma xenopodis TaxID=117903 RepID=A0A3S5A9P2_9PLAT|nr:unnamed protein product [Protopolystoma xenopodis]